MKQTSADYHIRPMQPEDLALALEWARQEGWNPGQADATLFMRADPQGFFVGELQGQPVAMLSGWSRCCGMTASFSPPRGLPFCRTGCRRRRPRPAP